MERVSHVAIVVELDNAGAGTISPYDEHST